MKQRISMQTQKEMNLEELFNKFKTKCIVKNLSNATIEDYYYSYVAFLKFYKNNSVSNITQDTIDDYILYLKARNLTDTSINSYLRQIRTILYYGMDIGQITEFKIHLIKVDKKIKDIYTDAELEILLKKPNIKKCSFTEYRIWVYSCFLLSTGVRISSALNIQIKDIDFYNELILIKKTKNRKQQYIPMTKKLTSILKEYLEYRNGTSEDYLFCDIYGNKATIRCYQDALKFYNHRRGITKTSSHLYRHTFASYFVKSCGSSITLQKLLGHSDITMTKEYVNMFSSDLKNGFEQHNALNNININVKQDTIKFKK